MNFENRLATVEVGRIHDDLAIKPAGPEQGAIEDFGAVGGGENDDTGVGLEAVHLDEQGVERLLALVVHRANVDATLAADGIQLVNKDDAGRLLLGLFEQVAHARRADAHEHLDEISTAQGEERHVGFTGHGPSEQRLARAGRADEQRSFRDARAKQLDSPWDS